MIDLNNQNEVARFILANVGSHKQFSLGTVSADSMPWVVCLNLSYDEKFNIIWKSEKSTFHSQHLSQNSNVAICIFSEHPQRGDFGLYISAKAHEVKEEKELSRLIYIRFTRKGKPTPAIDEFIGSSSSRLYFAETQEMYFNDSRHAKTRVDLDILRGALSKDGANYERRHSNLIN